MAKVTWVFAVLLVALGLAGFFGTGSVHYTALIPAWIGLALGACAILAMSPDVNRRKLFMHINATIGLVAFLGTAAEIVRNMVFSNPLDTTAAIAKLALLWLLFFYLVFCVVSFATARRSGKV
jgi:hypothetical protein